MDPGIAALLASGALNLVNTAATRAGNGVWDLVGPKLAQLFGRGDATREAAALERLNKTADALEHATDADRDRIRSQQRDAWKTRLEDFLEEHAETEAELMALLKQLSTKPSAAAQTVYEQNNTAQNAPVFAVQGPDSKLVYHSEPPASQA